MRQVFRAISLGLYAREMERLGASSIAAQIMEQAMASVRSKQEAEA